MLFDLAPLSNPIRESYEHWCRMVKCVEAGNEDVVPTAESIAKRLGGETYDAAHCALCREYLGAVGCSEQCPLVQDGQACNWDTSLYTQITRANTWADWLIPARKLRDLLGEMCGAFPKPKKYRPWTADEAIGKAVRKGGVAYVVISDTDSQGPGLAVFWSRNGCMYSHFVDVQTLLDLYVQTDGSPCGVEVAE